MVSLRWVTHVNYFFLSNSIAFLGNRFAINAFYSYFMPSINYRVNYLQKVDEMCVHEKRCVPFNFYRLKPQLVKSLWEVRRIQKISFFFFFLINQLLAILKCWTRIIEVVRNMHKEWGWVSGLFNMFIDPKQNKKKIYFTISDFFCRLFKLNFECSKQKKETTKKNHKKKRL